MTTPEEGLKRLAVFLVQRRAIEVKDLERVLRFQASIDARMGQLALMKRYMTPGDVQSILNSQLDSDIPFGGIAIQRGLLTLEKVEELVALQEDPFRLFTECLVMQRAIPEAELAAILAEFRRLTGIAFLPKEQAAARSSATRIATSPPNRSSRVISTRKAESLKDSLRKIRALGALPGVAQNALALLREPEADLAKVGLTLKTDVGLSSRLLHLTNSAFFGLRRKVANLDKAILTLGENGVRHAVMTACVLEKFKDVQTAALNEIMAESVLTAQWARVLLAQRGAGSAGLEEAFLAGTLHNMGQLAIQQYFSQQAPEIAKLTQAGTDVLAAEESVLGLPHTEIGAFLCNQWNFPDTLSQAALYHHVPASALGNLHLSNTVMAVNAACRLSQLPVVAVAGSAEQKTVDPASLDAEFLAVHALSAAWIVEKAPAVLQEAENLRGMYTLANN